MTHSSEGVVGKAADVIWDWMYGPPEKRIQSTKAFIFDLARALEKAGLLSGGNVRIRLPKRRESKGWPSAVLSSGWNACLDEVKRLNRKKAR